MVERAFKTTRLQSRIPHVSNDFGLCVLVATVTQSDDLFFVNYMPHKRGKHLPKSLK